MTSGSAGALAISLTPSAGLTPIHSSAFARDRIAASTRMRVRTVDRANTTFPLPIRSSSCRRSTRPAGITTYFILDADYGCAATLHNQGQHIDDASDAAVALRPLAGSAATTLFGVGLVGAALLAAAIVPLSTAYSVAEAFDKRSDLNDTFRQAPLFYGAYAGCALIAVTIVLIPGAPLIPILFLTQALNAVLLLAILPFLRALRATRPSWGRTGSAPPPRPQPR